MATHKFKQKVVEVLEKYGYKTGYSPYHSKEDIENFAATEKNLDVTSYFTVYDVNGYVVCRLGGLKESSNMTAYYLVKIKDCFQMFEIPHKENILSELGNIS